MVPRVTMKDGIRVDIKQDAIDRAQHKGDEDGEQSGRYGTNHTEDGRAVGHKIHKGERGDT